MPLNKKDKDNYIEACAKCHWKYDKENENYCNKITVDRTRKLAKQVKSAMLEHHRNPYIYPQAEVMRQLKINSHHEFYRKFYRTMMLERKKEL